MQTRTKIAEEIAALAAEVRELVRQHGVGLPNVDTQCEFIVAAFGYQRARELAEAADFRGFGVFADEVRKLEIAPAAEQLRSCAAAAVEAADHSDLPAFKRASRQLRDALLALLEARAHKWRHLWAARELYPIPSLGTADPVEHVRAAVAELTRWEVLEWAGRALGCAGEDVWLWRFWQTGWREHQEDALRRGQLGIAEAAWQREVAQHTLPEAEALIVDSWPVPPDEEWPETYTQTSLPRLREWQAKQAVLEGPPEAAAGDASAQ